MQAICVILQLYVLVILARMVFSWIRVESDSPWATVETTLLRLTEPVLGPLRRTIPPVRMGVAYLDLSPIIVIVLIQIIC